MDKPAIQFEKVNKSFGYESILSEFELDIQKGEFVSIVGPSGCGKSTLLRLVAGLEDADSGRVKLNESSSRPNETAFVFQESNLLPWLNVLDNVALPFRITRQAVNREKITEVLHMVGLPSDAHQKYPKQLSGGMKMRVSLARALVTNPVTLLLDEPFAALDDLLRTTLNIELMDIWSRDQLTTLFVTHNIAEAVFVSQKILVMHKGSSAPLSVEIPFEYPRSKSIKSTPEFAQLFAEVSELLESGLDANEPGGKESSGGKEVSGEELSGEEETGNEVTGKEVGDADVDA